MSEASFDDAPFRLEFCDRLASLFSALANLLIQLKMSNIFCPEMWTTLDRLCSSLRGPLLSSIFATWLRFLCSPSCAHQISAITSMCHNVHSESGNLAECPRFRIA